MVRKNLNYRLADYPSHKKKWYKKKYVKIILIIIGALAIGSVFFTSKTKIKKLETQSRIDKQTISNQKQKIFSLEQVNKSHKQYEKTTHIKNKDGSEKTETIKMSEAVEQRIRIIKAEYEQKIFSLEKQISILKEYNKVEINKRSVGIEVGITLNRAYYMHAQIDVFGPLFIGVHGQAGNGYTVGAGIGIRI